MLSNHPTAVTLSPNADDPFFAFPITPSYSPIAPSPGDFNILQEHHANIATQRKDHKLSPSEVKVNYESEWASIFNDVPAPEPLAHEAEVFGRIYKPNLTRVANAAPAISTRAYDKTQANNLVLQPPFVAVSSAPADLQSENLKDGYFQRPVEVDWTRLAPYGTAHPLPTAPFAESGDLPTLVVPSSVPSRRRRSPDPISSRRSRSHSPFLASEYDRAMARLTTFSTARVAAPAQMIAPRSTPSPHPLLIQTPVEVLNAEQKAAARAARLAARFQDGRVPSVIRRSNSAASIPIAVRASVVPSQTGH